MELHQIAIDCIRLHAKIGHRDTYRGGEMKLKLDCGSLSVEIMGDPSITFHCGAECHTEIAGDIEQIVVIGQPIPRNDAIPRDQWEWIGHAGHFCCSQDCRFRLCTRIGEWLISTVGDYRPHGGNTRNVGSNWPYETMVFRTYPNCPRSYVGVPCHDGDEVECRSYDLAADASAGHMQMCEKYSKA